MLNRWDKVEGSLNKSRKNGKKKGKRERNNSIKDWLLIVSKDKINVKQVIKSKEKAKNKVNINKEVKKMNNK